MEDDTLSQSRAMTNSSPESSPTPKGDDKIDDTEEQHLEEREEDLGPVKEKPTWRKSSIPPAYSEDGRRIITEDECWDKLGYSWPTWKKWMLLTSIFAVQVSMNFNTSVFPSAIKQIAEHFHITEEIARVGQMIFLVLYAFGCELWAPWSEEFGRWPVLQ